MVVLAFAVLSWQATTFPTTTLPRWSYGYDLPETPTVLVNGQIKTVATGTGPVPASPAAPAVPSTLPHPADLVPGLASGLSFGIGERLSPMFLARAEVESGVAFRAKSGSAEIFYSLTPTNRVQLVIYFEPTTIVGSEARFAAIRANFDRRLGAPSYGRREKDESLTLAWRRPDDSRAALILVDRDGTLSIGVTLAAGIAFKDADLPTTPSGH